VAPAAAAAAAAATLPLLLLLLNAVCLLVSALGQVALYSKGLVAVYLHQAQQQQQGTSDLLGLILRAGVLVLEYSQQQQEEERHLVAEGSSELLALIPRAWVLGLGSSQQQQQQ
jgi:hypothetical protein